ncbi:hypothetical protein G7B40_037740 [Aetokthonos hydrillicola Thurmond2011]|jgi:hypothetical protein|uniref:Uncharacterized protein n=1 Tax=Aetokthonos hydrillicola Thurmond2011 TaxID=2712845 RepID=A0AAP5IGX0_9CYAN|nr:hypothetical protein [Aetokthonos hydrillicola]MBO3461190.1 hypothetical protein [Aetokthonos hydrillicola CCALA 1050]MBW4589756.1 hypothetical protein [Aetokthonos hydrillicola CCALA 1050]MDR9900252.1 hypothetical protein [Aetokthonos hydrillicola Thurmond2011]
MINNKIISSILIAALSFNAVKPAQAQVQALPLVGAACSNPATCIVVGAVVVGSVIYLILKDDSTGQQHKLPVNEPRDEASGNTHMKLPENIRTYATGTGDRSILVHMYCMTNAFYNS